MYGHLLPHLLASHISSIALTEARRISRNMTSAINHDTTTRFTVNRLHRGDYYAVTKSITRSVPHPFFGKAIKIPVIDLMRRIGPSNNHILLRACSDCASPSN
jgi:hypothetical protein